MDNEFNQIIIQLEEKIDISNNMLRQLHLIARNIRIKSIINISALIVTVLATLSLSSVIFIFNLQKSNIYDLGKIILPISIMGILILIVNQIRINKKKDSIEIIINQGEYAVSSLKKCINNLSINRVSQNLYSLATKKIDNFENNTSKILNNIIKSSQELSKLNSQTLFGIIGGAIAIPISYIISNYTFMKFQEIISPMVIIGIAGFILLSRGGKWWKIDNKIVHYNNLTQELINTNRLLHQEIVNRIKNLPNNPPKSLMSNLWNYLEEINNFNISTGTGKKNKKVSIAKILSKKKIKTYAKS